VGITPLCLSGSAVEQEHNAIWFLGHGQVSFRRTAQRSVCVYGPAMLRQETALLDTLRHRAVAVKPSASMGKGPRVWLPNVLAPGFRLGVWLLSERRQVVLPGVPGWLVAWAERPGRQAGECRSAVRLLWAGGHRGLADPVTSRARQREQAEALGARSWAERMLIPGT
jgi:hypothetical protein